MIFDDVKKEDLFIKGLVEYNNQNFYDAHEFWEELWSDYKLEEPNLIQALIQVSVGYYHLSNLNILFENYTFVSTSRSNVVKPYFAYLV